MEGEQSETSFERNSHQVIVHNSNSIESLQDPSTPRLQCNTLAKTLNPRKSLAEKFISIATDDEYYDTAHSRRGVALIFNHFKFPTKSLPSRNGTSKDCDNIAIVLENLQFDVRVYNDLRYNELLRVLDQVSKEDHSANDCIVIVAMTHGDDGVLYAYDCAYPVHELWNYFIGNNCKSLVGKPKIVFIQACRGAKLDSGVKYRKDATTDGDHTDSRLSPQVIEYFIPQMADLLVMYSTYGGHYSWGNAREGSWFIQALCAELLQRGHNRDLLTILTGVSRRVAYEYQSHVPEKHYWMDCMKQMPSITSMLTKLFFFSMKS